MLKGHKPVWLEKCEQGWSITFKGNHSDSMKICVLKVESLNLNYVIYSNIQIIDVNFTENMTMIMHSIFYISINIKHLLFWSISLYVILYLYYIFTKMVHLFAKGRANARHTFSRLLGLVPVGLSSLSLGTLCIYVFLLVTHLHSCLLTKY